MKYIISTLMLSVLIPTLAFADRIKVDQLGYPFNAPADTYDSGDLSYVEVFGDEMAQAVLHPTQVSVKNSEAVKEFINNPLLRNYLLRELQTFENLPDPVAKSFVTAVSILNEETGENFIALFAPNPTKALEALSLQKNLLPEEAKVEYFKHPKMETGQYFTEDQKARVLQFMQDNFKISKQEDPMYRDAMGDFETN